MKADEATICQMFMDKNFFFTHTRVLITKLPVHTDMMANKLATTQQYITLFSSEDVEKEFRVQWRCPSSSLMMIIISFVTLRKSLNFQGSQFSSLRRARGLKALLALNWASLLPLPCSSGASWCPSGRPHLAQDSQWGHPRAGSWSRANGSLGPWDRVPRPQFSSENRWGVVRRGRVVNLPEQLCPVS